MAQAGGRTRRRTQQERREGTIAKLIDATIDAIGEVGYARMSLNEVCSRAGTSRGGLFAHFATREDLVVAAAEEVARRQVAQARQRLADVSLDETSGLITAIEALRANTRSPIDAVFHELLVAARTDDALATKLRPAWVAYYLDSYQLAADLFGVENDSERSFETVLFALMAVFSVEALSQVISIDPALEEARLQWATRTTEAELRRLQG